MHGRGLIASTPFAAGTLAALLWFETCGKQINVGHSPVYFPRGCSTLSDAHLRDREPDSLIGCFERLVNHACSPSAEIVRVACPAFVSEREIAIGTISPNHRITCSGSTSPSCMEYWANATAARHRRPKRLHGDRASAAPTWAYYLRTIRALNAGEELTANYMTAPPFIKKPQHLGFTSFC